MFTPEGKAESYPVPRALEVSEIPGIVKKYATAARNSLEAGKHCLLGCILTCKILCCRSYATGKHLHAYCNGLNCTHLLRKSCARGLHVWCRLPWR